MRLTMRIFGRRRHNVLRSAVFFLLWTTLTTVLASPTAIVTKIKTVPETKASVGNQDVVLGGFRTVKKDIATNDSHPDVPSVGRILRFAVPAIGVWIYFPMLSMIDTSIVGKVAGTQQQAALNPAIAVINYSAKLLSFLYTGTTTLVAASAAADRGKTEKHRTVDTLVGALQLSLIVGCALGIIMYVFAQTFLTTIMGTTIENADVAVMEPALEYVKIRALAMPAAAILGSVQTACLGMQDVKSPLYATILASIVNLIANIILVPASKVATTSATWSWLTKSGAASAAWGTVLAQYVTLFASIYWFCGSSKRTTNNPTFTRGFLAGKFAMRDFLRLPDKSVAKGFVQYFIPVTTTQVGRCSASATLDHVVTSSMGTVNMAANQIITSVFYGLIPLADSLSLAAQSFVPVLAQRNNSPEKARLLMDLQRNFLKAAGLCGATLSTVMALMPFGSRLFTSDPDVIKTIISILPIHFVISSMHGIFCGSEGMLLGYKDLGFLSRMYGVFTLVIPYLLLRIKRAALAGSSDVSLASVWQVFLGLQITRVCLMAGRVWWLQAHSDQPLTKRKDKE